MSAAKNTEMTATSQHDFHPDAERLNAFAERALDERERGQVLAHLAVCSRCRQIVVLAQDAAETDAVREPQPVAVRPIAWRKRGWLVWLPTAAMATLTVVSLAVLVHHAQQRDVAIDTAQQAAASGIDAATAPAPSGPVETAPKPAREAANSLTETAAPSPKPKASSVASPAREPELAAESAALPPAAPAKTVDVAQNQMKPQLVRPSQESATESSPQLQVSAFLASPSAPSQEQQKETAQDKKQMDATIVQDRLFAAKAAPPPTETSAAIGAVQPASSASGKISSQPPELRPKLLGGFAGIMASRTAIAAGPIGPVHLPSGLAALSIASANHRFLAIDKAGSLFVSDDGGTTWKSVAIQWTGRAISVLVQKAPVATINAAMQAQSASSASADNEPSAAAGSATPPSTSFEIVNDNGDKWWSTDGLLWIAK
jgi:Putative zinc-finger